ncbi:MAG: hypothetical protein HYV95_11095 [Opitutae bacterium]|nr:hypothetical protein [Opitutae bacterium]
MNLGFHHHAIRRRFHVLAGLALFYGSCLYADTKEPVKPAPEASTLPTPGASGKIGPAAQFWEFNGLLIDEGGEFFRIVERSSGSVHWVGLNEAGAPFIVRRYDSRRQVVIVEYRGRVSAIPLRRAKMAATVPVDHRDTAPEWEPRTPEATPPPATPTSVAVQPGGSARVEAIRKEAKATTNREESAKPANAVKK